MQIWHLQKEELKIPPMDAISKAFYDYCKANGLKKTVPRRAVFELFYHGDIHISVDDVFRQIRKKLPSIKEESLYRVLADLERTGNIRRMDIRGVMKYESAKTVHDHFVCSQCGRIIDVKSFGVSAPKTLKNVSISSVTVYGICPECQKAKE